ncbi:MAG TPA: hypothetical protein VK544_08205 [Gemmatimonadaceae bacterium]|nr:hypothetical protein [Gemmatimonadaceae bacterium]
MTATGVYDGRNDTRCAMNLSVNNALVNGGNFGTCGGNVHDDTVKIVGASTTVSRGEKPKQNSYDCDIWGIAICHTVSGTTLLRLRPIAVALKKPTAFPRTVNFANTTSQIAFTIRPNPGTLLLGANLQTITLAATSWQWSGADSTRAQPTCPIPSGVGPDRQCLFTPKESGRLTVKAFVGGYEQTNSVTVQCLTSPLDSILNDTTNDFQVRSALLKMLDSSHPEVAPGFGYDSVKGRGLMHEIGGNVWKLPNNGGYMLVPGDSSKNTECMSYFDSAAPPPVSGAVLSGRAHTHQSPWDGPVYGCETKVFNNGRDSIQFSKFPGDTANGKRPFTKNRKDIVKGGSGQDWFSMIMDLPPKPDYVIDADGTVAEVSYYTLANSGRIHNWAPSTAAKCAWVR